jgi:hypothetical protein
MPWALPCHLPPAVACCCHTSGEALGSTPGIAYIACVDASAIRWRLTVTAGAFECLPWPLPPDRAESDSRPFILMRNLCAGSRGEPYGN